jgi:hypothetical protein
MVRTSAVSAVLTVMVGRQAGLRKRTRGERIETGLQLYASPERNGVEFPVEGGRMDLLAVDGNGKFVVIELKLSQGRNKTLGQLLYYMGWVDKNLARDLVEVSLSPVTSPRNYPSPPLALRVSA